MEIITSDKAPAAIGPYSQAVKTGNFLFCSGQVGIDPATKGLAGGDIETQTLQVLKNMKEVLKASGLDLTNIVKTTVFLCNMDDFPTMNAIYAKEFGKHKPARSTMQVARLPLDALIEIECIAVYSK
jgi:2-iminobutanoate/2-iminopropanoate deaminase